MKKKTRVKNKKKTSYPDDTEKLSIVEEPEVEYRTYPTYPSVKEFTFNRFRKIYDMAPFTFKEWANFLHLSERTLLRYAKENKSFEGIYVDRILLLERLFQKGKQVFASEETFYAWLTRPKKVLNQILDENALTTTEGILATEEELGRIEQGVYI